MTDKNSANVGNEKPKQRKGFSSNEEDMIIEYYSQNENLWDPKHSDYKIGVKSLTIQKLVQDLGNKFTPSEIHHRFSGMRTTYRANSNKVGASKTTGSDGTKVYLPTWPHYDSMKFLDASKPTRTSVTSYTVQSIDENDTSISDEVDLSQMEVEADMQDQNTQSKPTSSKANVKRSTPSKGKRCNNDDLTPFKGKRGNNDDLVSECLNVLRSVNNENEDPLVTAKEITDRCAVFGEFVTASLKDMGQWQQTLAMVETTNVLVKYYRNNPNVA